MVDDIRTNKLTREQIAAFVGNNPRAIKLIENLALDVSVAIPTAIDDVQSMVSLSEAAAAIAQAAANRALELAGAISVVLHTSRATSQPDDLRRRLDDLEQRTIAADRRTNTNTLLQRIDDLEQRINAAERQGNTDDLRRRLDDLQTQFLAS